jgi:2-keto-4-pentenoate hydratase/2-oxohepta-3-ene-1,7-dioic acid hydratase in catechol pathway
MKLCMFSPKGMALPRGWPGRIDGDRVIQLAAQTLQAFFTGGGGAREHAEYPLAEVDLRAPVMSPPSVRLFDGPDFVFGNTASIFGPEDDVPYPEGSRELALGLGFAAVIGAEGAIGGYTLANQWFAPDLPGTKSRDFALSIGPVLVTEPVEWTVGGSMNGEHPASMSYDVAWDELAAHAAMNTQLLPGDLLVVSSSPAGAAPLERGDAVEIEAEGIGVLRNRVA